MPTDIHNESKKPKKPRMIRELTIWFMSMAIVTASYSLLVTHDFTFNDKLDVMRASFAGCLLAILYLPFRQTTRKFNEIGLAEKLWLLIAVGLTASVPIYSGIILALWSWLFGYQSIHTIYRYDPQKIESIRDKLIRLEFFK